MALKLRQRVNPSGNICWQVDYGKIDGKRVQRSYPTKAAAELAMRQGRRAQAEFGDISHISPSELAEVLILKEKLSKYDATLFEAVEFYVKHSVPLKNEIWLSDLIEKYIELKENTNSMRHAQSVRTRLRPLGRYYPTLRAHEFTKANAEKWLSSGEWKKKTQLNKLIELRAMLNWAIKEGYLRQNVVKEIVIKDDNDGDIVSLSVDECQRLVDAATGTRFQAYVALALFCGLRRSEILNLKWDDINLDEGYVKISAKIAKGRHGMKKRRVVDISANALTMLKTASRAVRGRIFSTNFHEQFPKFRKKAGFEFWPNNAFRHTYASMHYAHHQNEALLKVQMGHSHSSEILHQHYRGLRTKKEAMLFWNMTPSLKVRAAKTASAA